MAEEPTMDIVVTHAPTPSEGDAVHSSIRVLLSAMTGGVAGELFEALVRPPFQRRLQEWTIGVENRIRSLYDRDRTIEAYLHSEVFLSVLLVSMQAAGRAHHNEKRLLLANAVESSAMGIDLSADKQVLFVRFIDELTTTHVALLEILHRMEAQAAQSESYEELYETIVRPAGMTCRRDELALFCNDLQTRALVVFSEVLDSYPGIAVSSALLLETAGRGPKVLVTNLGKEFLAFVGDR